ncbi:MAG: hypothetical protein ACT6Q8_17000 [Niveispirillum sp.]|uniref:hypothetical protein n=1 Tax=Niveispirillum sp. TaxID=1917217 RepID=UPI004036914A
MAEAPEAALTGTPDLMVGRFVDLGFVESEDRIFLSVRDDAQRVDFWLTRRLARRLLAGLMELLGQTSHSASDAAARNRQEVLLFEQAEALSRRNATAADNIPLPSLPRKSGPYLLDRLDLHADSQHLIMMLFNQEKEKARLRCSREHGFQLVGLLYDKICEAEWDIGELAWLNRRSTMDIPRDRLLS